MDPTLAQGRAVPGPVEADRAAGRWAVGAGTAIVLAMLAIYIVSNPVRTNFYDHFVWQASAWLEGQAAIRYPVDQVDDRPWNAYFQDVLEVPTTDGVSRALIPFPPLPAVVLLPFVAAFGLATDAQLIASVLGALVVGVAFWVLGRLPVRQNVRIATTVVFGLGTVFWYAAELGSTWYLAHVVAVGLAFLAIAMALEGDPAAAEEAGRATAGTQPVTGDTQQAPGSQAPSGSLPPTAGSAPDAAPGRRLPRAVPEPATVIRSIDRRQVLAGLLLGLAATSRLTLALGLPFLVLVGPGGTWRRRAASAALGMAVPVLGLAAYDLVSTGHLFSPVYEHLYRTEISFYPPLFPYLDYHADWGIEDPRYIVQNLRLMLLNVPVIGAACPDWVPSTPLDPLCAVQPRADGMSLLLTSPALLLALPVLSAFRRSRLVAGATLAVGAIALADLMHFSQGWVQFGYRFSNDFIPFLLLLVALGMERVGGVTRVVAALVAVSVAVNLWGVVWGHVLKW